MKNIKNISIVVLLSITVLLSGCDSLNKFFPNRNATKEDHSGHDHGSGSHDDHSSHEKEDHSGHDHGSHSSQEHIDLTEKAKKNINLKISTVKIGSILKRYQTTGEVLVNPEGISSVYPRYAGRIISLHKKVGDAVRAGETIAIMENKETFTRFSVTAPLSGIITERPVNGNIFISDEQSLYTIENHEKLFVNIKVFPKDIALVKLGQNFSIAEQTSGKRGTVTIDYISPHFDHKTQTYTVRGSLNNSDGKWSPGLFIRSSFLYKSAENVLTVSKDAIQMFNNTPMIFVPEGASQKTFVPVPVKLGAQNNFLYEIKSGLQEGASYVSTGSFELKSQVIVGKLGAHAGHGHAH